MILRFILIFVLFSIVLTVVRIVKLMFKATATNQKYRNYHSPQGKTEKDISGVAKIIEEKPLDQPDDKE